MAIPLVSWERVSYGFEGSRPLGLELSFSLQAGEALFIQGANGSGKTTLIRVLMGQLQALSGVSRVSVSSDRIGYLSQAQDKQCHIPMRLMDVLQVMDPRPNSKARALEWGLLSESQLAIAWNSASGGERQRTLLTAELLREPQLLILDEPMNHLDHESRVRVARALTRFQSTGLTPRGLIIVAHPGAGLGENWGLRNVKRLRLGQVSE